MVTSRPSGPGRIPEVPAVWPELIGREESGCWIRGDGACYATSPARSHHDVAHALRAVGTGPAEDWNIAHPGWVQVRANGKLYGLRLTSRQRRAVMAIVRAAPYGLYRQRLAAAFRDTMNLDLRQADVPMITLGPSW